MSIAQLRTAYHRKLCAQALFMKKDVPNIADLSSAASSAIAQELIRQIGHPLTEKSLSGQTAGDLFEQFTKEFLQESFNLLQRLRPGKWLFSVRSLSEFEQYEHLGDLQRILHEQPGLRAALGGDYLITPDITIGRYPASDDEINQETLIVGDSITTCQYSPLRAVNRPTPKLILHASISCKWTMRSDRAQSIRAEGLNLIRNRKGHTPHIVAVTAEPLPTRLASLALGTGDLDCTYHFALPELKAAVTKTGSSEQLELLMAMIDGRRLRDISDLPLDLII